MKKFVVALLLMIIVVDMFCPSEAFFWRRRRRRRPPPCSLRAKHLGWKNDFDGRLKFRCPTGQAINNFQSIYRPCARDRAFYFRCSSNAWTRRMTKCSWTNHWINDWDQPISFVCPYHGVMTGVESYHSDRHEDRRWKFRCCHSNFYHARYCKLSGYVNNWRSRIRYTVPWNRFIVGAYSHHSNHYEDRRWKFNYCRVY